MGKELSLLDYCREVSTIECGACNRVETAQDEALYAVEDFYNNGWRVRKKICYCPTCAKENGLK